MISIYRNQNVIKKGVALIMKVKKRLALFISAAMTFSMFTAYPAATAEASEFVNSTYFYGFDTNGTLGSASRPVWINTGTCTATATSGILNVVSKNNGDTTHPRIHIPQSFSTSEINRVLIRMKRQLISNDENITTSSFTLFFKGDDMSTFDGTHKTNTDKSVSLTTDGYENYIVNLSNATNYNSLSTIDEIRIDLFTASLGGSVDIDYIMLYKEDSNIKVWDFDSDKDLADWVPKSGSSNVASPSVSGGLYTQTAAGASTAPRLIYSPPEPIYTTDYDAVEVIMKHEYAEGAVAGDKAQLNMYLTGTNYSSGTPVDLDQNSGRVQNTLSDSSGDNFYRYVFKFEKLQNNTAINDAKITQIRIDPIRDAGTYYIDSIRLIPKNYADMADVGGHEEGSDDAHINMGFTVETEHISDYNSIKVKVNNGSKRLVGGYDLSDTFGSMSGPVKLGLQINDVPKDYENYITVQLSPDAVKSVNANETDLRTD